MIKMRFIRISICVVLFLALFPAARAAGLAPTYNYLPFTILGTRPTPPSEGLVIDHRHTDVSKIPDYWIEQAKTLTVQHAHTSHGGQILEGLGWLEDRNPKYKFAISYGDGGPNLPDVGDALRIYDGNNYDGNSYITPEMYWETSGGISHTRSVLGTGLYRLSLWTWCGQMSYYGEDQIQNYLNTMAQFGTDYPGVQMILFTGHTDGSTPDSGSDLWRNNNLVRAYVQEHSGTVLFDFADIESYDPAGNQYPDTNDGCSWCTKWCQDHPNDFSCQQLPSCAHSNGLQCTLKAQAYWWMMARMAGWDGVTQ